MKITLYSSPHCPYCLQAKNYLESQKLDFDEIDVASNQEAAERMVKISGQMGVPVIQINDQVVVGFDQARIDSIIKTINE